MLAAQQLFESLDTMQRIEVDEHVPILDWRPTGYNSRELRRALLGAWVVLQHQPHNLQFGYVPSLLLLTATQKYSLIFLQCNTTQIYSMRLNSQLLSFANQRRGP